jgi:hypothetical protein
MYVCIHVPEIIRVQVVYTHASTRERGGKEGVGGENYLYTGKWFTRANTGLVYRPCPFHTTQRRFDRWNPFYTTRAGFDIGVWFHTTQPSSDL